jgi:tetratricopeptide (TPR) repeat protein
MAGLAVAVIVAIAIVASLWNGGSTVVPNRVLVTPFENRTGDSALALLGDMTVDWIVQGLRAVEVVDVVPTASGVVGESAEAGAAQPGEVASQLAAAQRAGAAVIVAGAYYLRGDSLQFQAQLIGSITGRLINAVPPVSGPVDAAGDVISQMSDNVVRLLAANLDPRVYHIEGQAQPPTLDAYREFVTGREVFNQGRMHDAMEYFYRAAALDTLFFDTRYFLILSHYNVGELAAADSNAALLEGMRTRMTRWQRYAYDWAATLARGSRVDELNAARLVGGWDLVQAALRANYPREALAVLEDLRDAGNMSPTRRTPRFWDNITTALHMLGEHERELGEARQGREHFPEHFSTLHNELVALVALGRVEEVREGIERSRLLPPQQGWLAPGLMSLVAAELRRHGHREASLEVAQRAVDWYLMRPAEEMNDPFRRYSLMELYYQAERFADAEPLAEELVAQYPTNIDYVGYLGTLAARRGDVTEARRISHSLGELGDVYDHGNHTYWQACIAAQLGEAERAMLLLRDAFSQGRSFDLWLHRDMDFEPLWDYPPFQEFIRPKG